jgi:hypothetical protein
MWSIKNQPSNSMSCSDNALHLLILVAGILYWGLQGTSSFSIWDCVLKGCFERSIFWRAKLYFKGIEDSWTLHAIPWCCRDLFVLIAIRWREVPKPRELHQEFLACFGWESYNASSSVAWNWFLMRLWLHRILWILWPVLDESHAINSFVVLSLHLWS